MIAPALKEPELDLSNFEMVEAAVRQTDRGRWFLDEFSRRSRQRETLSLLAAMRKIENVVVSDKRGVDFPTIRAHIEECCKMSATIRAEIDKQVFPLDPSVPALVRSIERHLVSIAQMIIEGADAPTSEQRATPSPAAGSASPTEQILTQDRFVFQQ